MNNSKPLLFRIHRGSLEDSMKTVKEIDSMETLKSIIDKDWWNWMVEASDIQIEPYVYDDRIDWDTHIVTAHFEGLKDHTRCVVGFLNKIPDWEIEIDAPISEGK